MSKSENKGLIVTIIIAAVLVSGSFAFFAFNGFGGCLSADDLKTAVIDGFTEVITGEPTESNVEKTDDTDTETEDETDNAEIVPAITGNETPEVSGDIVDSDAVLGEENAPVTIVEFSDYQCPYCASFYNEAYQQIKEKYVNTGKVKLVFRDFPLGFHKGAMPAAIAAECVRDQLGNEGYFEMHNKIFENQKILSSTDVGGELKKLAAGLGVEETEFATCLDKEKYKSEVEADIKDGKQFGISGTPSFLINGRLLQGAYPFSEFEKMIEEELQK